MRLLVALALTGALAIIGCGSDDNNTGGSGATGGGAAGTGGSGAVGGSGGTGGTAGTGGSAGMGGSGGSAEAIAFCVRYEPTCGFGPGRYADNDDCVAMYDGFSVAKQTCVEEHLTNAEGGMTDLHCGHATGETICDLD